MANVSHELRTPLHGILGLVDVALHDQSLSEEQKSHLRGIGQSGKLLLVVINDVLDHSKIAAGKLELERIPFSINTTLSEVRQLMGELAKAKGVHLTFDISPDVPAAVEGDPQRLKQVCMNLLSNALRFTPPGGLVSLTCCLAGQGGSTGRPTATLRFSVRDCGMGMTPETQARLFTPFAQADSSITRRFGGTGLGLVISKQLVTLMGGDITVDSAIDEGTTFTFTVKLPHRAAGEVAVESPRHRAATSATWATAPPCRRRSTSDPASIEAAESPEAACRVLLAEDNAVNAMIAKRFLRNLGYTDVTVMENGQLAVDAVASSGFDLVLMDCQMPVMDGYEACRRIRALTDAKKSRVPIIALTASALKADVDRCRAAGMDDHLSKPYNSRDLSLVLQRWALHRSFPEAPAAGAGGPQRVDHE
jgi:CheY-like chemotaxis protein